MVSALPLLGFEATDYFCNVLFCCIFVGCCSGIYLLLPILVLFHLRTCVLSYLFLCWDSCVLGLVCLCHVFWMRIVSAMLACCGFVGCCFGSKLLLQIWFLLSLHVFECVYFCVVDMLLYYTCIHAYLIIQDQFLIWDKCACSVSTPPYVGSINYHKICYQVSQAS